MKLTNSTTGALELTIDTVAATNLQLGEISISADRRSPKEGPELSDAERIRRVILPAGNWGNIQGCIHNPLESAPTANQGLTDVLTKGLREIASARLKDYLQEQPMARTVALADYSVTALLSWSADTASSRGSLTFERSEVEAWFPTSKLAARNAGNKAALSYICNRLACLAAKNHGLTTAEDCDKLTALLGADCEEVAAVPATDTAPAVPAVPAVPIVGELIQRLAHISKQFAAKKNDKVVSMDDLK